MAKRSHFWAICCAKGRGAIICILRRAALCQWSAGHSPRNGPRHQGYFLPLSNVKRQTSSPQSGLGYPRPSCRARRRERIGHYQRRHRHQNQCRSIQRSLQDSRDALHRHLECAYPTNGLLGRHAKPVCYLPAQIYGVSLVVVVSTLQQRPHL